MLYKTNPVLHICSRTRGVYHTLGYTQSIQAAYNAAQEAYFNLSFKVYYPFLSEFLIHYLSFLVLI